MTSVAGTVLGASGSESHTRRCNLLATKSRGPGGGWSVPWVETCKEEEVRVQSYSFIWRRFLWEAG